MKLKGTHNVFSNVENDEFEVSIDKGWTQLIRKNGSSMGDRYMYEGNVLNFYEKSLNNLEVKGDVLLVGLGLGTLYYNWKDLPEVKSITAIEIHQEIIDLVKPVFPGMKYICADAFEYDGIERFDTIFLDIFHKQTVDYLETQELLIKKYKRFFKNWRYIKDYKKCLAYLHIGNIDLDHLL
jgi:hypothetical protein